MWLKSTICIVTGGRPGGQAGQYEDTYVNTMQYITSKLDTLAELLKKDTVQ
jgi:hypothetical protein